MFIIFFHNTDKEGIESQDRHQQESLKNRIVHPTCNKSQSESVSITRKK